MKKLQPLSYAVLIAIGIYIGRIENNTLKKNNSKINTILQIIEQHYVDTINYNNFKDDAINSILNDLDPHSSYISIKDFKSVEEDMQGSFSGIGVQFNIIDDSIVVVAPISGGPSEKLGIQSGDRIVTVEKEDVAGKGIKNDDVIKLLRGEKGSKVNIKIKRNGQNNVIPFTIIRDDIPLYSVDAGIMLNDDIGYIKINRFAAKTYTEMMEKSTQLTSKGMKKLILDLRGNPGGYLHIANQICDEFLKDGELVVFTEGRNRSRQETIATSYGALEKIDVVVLINEGSASASEIVAGALQDNDRGLIIGRRSFGKGLVQEQISLNDGSAIRLTTQRYYTPSGRCIQKDYKYNRTDYFLEQYKREKEIRHTDSLKYTTKKGRIVYGGGGITPDIIIERDTTENYLQINIMISKGWVNEFCLKESNVLKKENLTNYSKIDFDDIYNNYLNFINKKDVNFKIKLGAKESAYFKNLLIANISRNLWDNDTYYQVISIHDEFIQKAIKEL